MRSDGAKAHPPKPKAKRPAAAIAAKLRYSLITISVE